MERLRTRRHANEGVSDLPGQDDSKQWDELLGNGAKKKPRCGICTRPIADEAQETKALLCSMCQELPTAGPARRRSIHCHSSKERASTPSTHADSEDLDGSLDTVPLRDSDDVEVMARRLVAVSKGLEGEWIGHKGEYYRIEATDNGHWTCVFQYGSGARKIPFFHDKTSKTVWWGSRGEYYLNALDVCECPDKITWFPFEQSSGPKIHFVWHRPPVPKPIRYHVPVSQASPQSTEKRTLRPTKAGAEPKHFDEIVATAIHEVEDQLYTPGNNGFVWVDKWNEQYLRYLGTLRNFLESHPNRFTVIPGRGKGFRVALTNGDRNDWSQW